MSALRTDEQKAAVVARAVLWARQNPEKRKAIARAYYHRHKTTILEKTKLKKAAIPKTPRLPAKCTRPDRVHAVPRETPVTVAIFDYSSAHYARMPVASAFALTAGATP